MVMATININNEASCASARQLHIALCNNNDNNNAANNKALCPSAQYYHIVSSNGNNNNNTDATTTYVVNKPPVRRCMSFILQHIVLRDADNNKATMATTNDKCWQRGFKRECITCSHCVAQRVSTQYVHIVLRNGNNDTQTKNKCAQVHKLPIKDLMRKGMRHKPLCACLQAKASSIDTTINRPCQT